MFFVAVFSDKFFLSAVTTERCRRDACVCDELPQKHARASEERQSSECLQYTALNELNAFG